MKHTMLTITLSLLTFTACTPPSEQGNSARNPAAVKTIKLKLVSAYPLTLPVMGSSVKHVADQAAAEGIADLRSSGLKKVKDGLTSLEEINRVTID